MELINRINQDLKSAIKNSDTQTKEILRVLIGEINRLEKNVLKKNLAEEDILKLIKKLKQNAVELNNPKEVDILDKYLPEDLLEERLSEIIKEIIREKNIDSMKGIGVIMRELNAHPQSKQIDKRKASEIIKKEIL